jgi:hypothetical protein
LHPTLNATIGTFFPSCGRTENRTCIKVPSLLFRHRAKHRSIPIPPRWGGSLGVLEICSISTIMRAESGETVLFRQSDNAVFFFPMTCEALSANPPLRVCGSSGLEKVKTDRSSPQVSNFLANSATGLSRAHALTCKPLQTAFPIGVKCCTPFCSKVNASKSALVPSVHGSVASAIFVSVVNFDCRRERNLDKSSV